MPLMSLASTAIDQVRIDPAVPHRSGLARGFRMLVIRHRHRRSLEGRGDGIPPVACTIGRFCHDATLESLAVKRLRWFASRGGSLLLPSPVSPPGNVVVEAVSVGGGILILVPGATAGGTRSRADNRELPEVSADGYCMVRKVCPFGGRCLQLGPFRFCVCLPSPCLLRPDSRSISRLSPACRACTGRAVPTEDVVVSQQLAAEDWAME